MRKAIKLLLLGLGAFTALMMLVGIAIAIFSPTSLKTEPAKVVQPTAIATSTGASSDEMLAMIIFLLILGGVIFMIFRTSRTFQRRSNELKKNYSSTRKDLLRAGKYIGGHPNIDKGAVVQILPTPDRLVIMTFAKTIGDIQKSKIRNILVEDASTMQRRVTLGRVFLLGVFALAAQKNQKIEQAYVTIEWNDGQFDHHTVFEFGRMNDANILRNRLLQHMGSNKNSVS